MSPRSGPIQHPIDNLHERTRLVPKHRHVITITAPINMQLPQLTLRSMPSVNRHQVSLPATPSSPDHSTPITASRTPTCRTSVQPLRSLASKYWCPTQSALGTHYLTSTSTYCSTLGLQPHFAHSSETSVVVHHHNSFSLDHFMTIPALMTTLASCSAHVRETTYFYRDCPPPIISANQRRIKLPSKLPP